MVLTPSSGRARREPRGSAVGERAGAAVQASAPPDPREALGPSREPSTARSELHQKRVGQPATAAIGCRPGGFKKNGTAAHPPTPHPQPCDPQSGISPSFTPTPYLPGPGRRTAFVGAQTPTAEAELLRTLDGEGAGRAGCAYGCGMQYSSGAGW